MSFTKDDLKDGMVCTMRDGDTYALFGGMLMTPVDGGNHHINDYSSALIHRGELDKGMDLIKITYGGKTVFEREEWRELTIDEAFELLKSGPVRGEVYVTEDEKWSDFELRSLSPWADCGYHGVLGNYRKFRIKK